MAAEGAHHGAAFCEHKTLRKQIGGARWGSHNDIGSVGYGSRRECANGQLAATGLHVAQQAEAVVDAEDFFLTDVAMEVEAVESEALRLPDFALCERRCGPQAVHAPITPRDGGKQLNAAAVEAEDGVCSQAIRREPAKTKRTDAHVSFSACSGHDDAKAIEHRRVQIPEPCVQTVQAGLSKVRTVLRWGRMRLGGCAGDDTFRRRIEDLELERSGWHVARFCEGSYDFRIRRVQNPGIHKSGAVRSVVNNQFTVEAAKAVRAVEVDLSPANDGSIDPIVAATGIGHANGEAIRAAGIGRGGEVALERQLLHDGVAGKLAVQIDLSPHSSAANVQKDTLPFHCGGNLNFAPPPGDAPVRAVLGHGIFGSVTTFFRGVRTRTELTPEILLHSGGQRDSRVVGAALSRVQTLPSAGWEIGR